MLRGAARPLAIVLLLAWTALTFRNFGTSLSRATLVALGVGVVVLAVALFRPGAARAVADAIVRVRARTFVAGAALAAGLISWLVVDQVLRQRALSIDGSVYLFEARALSHLHFGSVVPKPSLWFGGRFLFEGPDQRIYGVFPPGFPLFVAAFVRLSMPLLAGPVIAAGMIVAQYCLGRGLFGDSRESELATRVSLLFTLPSFARAIETADLLSHAFAAMLGTFALAAALHLRERHEGKGTWLAVAVGVAIGWGLSARLLDGLMFGVGVAVILATRKVRARHLAIAAIAAAPFLLLIVAQQQASTGRWSKPTQTEYFERSDFPPTCHRLGFGRDVGCSVEHTSERASFGDDGYRLDDAFRIASSRAAVLGGDLLGIGPLALLAFVGAIARPTRRTIGAAGFVLFFSIGYGLFYYGNAPIFGARHLFPVAPLVFLLSAHALSTLPRAEGERVPAMLFALFACITAAQIPRWLYGISVSAPGHANRIDLRGMIERVGIAEGILITGDELSFIAAYDGWADLDARMIVRWDRAELKDLRRAHPSKTLHYALEGDTHRSARMPPPPPGLHIELERAWPSFQRPDRLGARVIHTQSCCKVTSSGEHALFVFVADVGSSIAIPFDVAQGGKYALRVDAMTGPDFGQWSFEIDGVHLSSFDGWAETVETRKGNTAEPRWLSAGRHVLVARCTGRASASKGYLAAFDALVGVPAP